VSKLLLSILLVLPGLADTITVGGGTPLFGGGSAYNDANYNSCCGEEIGQVTLNGALTWAVPGFTWNNLDQFTGASVVVRSVGAGTSEFTASLYSDSLPHCCGWTVPGSLVETLGTFSVGASETTIDMPASGSVMLQPSTAYWLVLSPVVGVTGWYGSPAAYFEFSQFPGDWTYTWPSSDLNFPDFTIYGNVIASYYPPVPEPSFIWPLVGALAFVLARRRFVRLSADQPRTRIRVAV
jgi:hypothetical protein